MRTVLLKWSIATVLKAGSVKHNPGLGNFSMLLHAIIMKIIILINNAD